MAKRERPLSPFMLGSLYRFQITSVMSFLHRATGVSLALGSGLLVWWLMALALGGNAWNLAAHFFSSPAGLILLFAFTLALVYHLLNGIRHLLWDAGWGFEIPQVYTSGFTVFVLGFIMTGMIWFIALGRLA